MMAEIDKRVMAEKVICASDTLITNQIIVFLGEH